MVANERCCPSAEKSKQSPKHNPRGETVGTMGKADRKQLVLGFLVHHGLALPPAALYRNLRLHHNATFSAKSLDNYLDELDTEGLVVRIDPDAMEERAVKPIDGGRGYWLPTEAGIEAADDSFSFE